MRRSIVLLLLLFPPWASAAVPHEMGDAMNHMVQRWNTWHESRQWREMERPASGPDNVTPWTPPENAARPDGGWVPQNTMHGVWKGTGGETLYLRNGRMRMTGSGGWISEGVYMTYADRLILYLAAEDAVRLYQYALRGDRLWIVDALGNRLIFRRRPGMH